MTNETLVQTLIAVNLAVSIIGGSFLVKWLVRHIRALEGTVKAQGETLATVTKLNDTLVNVFKAVDPERWAKEVTLYKDLVDRKAAAIVEEAERKFQEEKTTLSSRADEAMKRRGEYYGEAISLALRFMPWVSVSRRAQEIAETKLPDDVKTTLTQMAGEAPEWSAGGLRGRLGDILGSRLIVPEGMAETPLPLKAPIFSKSAEGKDQAAE